MFSDEEAEDMRFLPYLWQIMVIILIGVVVCLLYLPETPPRDVEMEARERDREIVWEHLLDFHDGHPEIYYPDGGVEPKGIVLVLHGGLAEETSLMNIFLNYEPVVNWYNQNGFMVVVPKIPFITMVVNVGWMEGYFNHKIKHLGKIFDLVDRIARERSIGVQVFASSEGGGTFMEIARRNPEKFNERVDKAILFSAALVSVNPNAMYKLLMTGDAGHQFMTHYAERHNDLFSEYGDNITVPTIFFFPKGDNIVMSSFGMTMFERHLNPRTSTIVTQINKGHSLDTHTIEWEKHVLEHSVGIYPHLQARLDWVNTRPH